MVITSPGAVVSFLGAPLPADLQEAEGFATFGCTLPTPQPNTEGLPERVLVEVRLPAAFPLGKVGVVPKDASLDGFAHQASGGLGGALCLLLTESEYPWAPRDRLVAHVRSAIGWVADAATSQLLKDGEPWELPDFRIGVVVPPPRPLLFSETSEALALWSRCRRLLGRCAWSNGRLIGNTWSCFAITLDPETGPKSRKPSLSDAGGTGGAFVTTGYGEDVHLIVHRRQDDRTVCWSLPMV